MKQNEKMQSNELACNLGYDPICEIIDNEEPNFEHEGYTEDELIDRLIENDSYCAGDLIYSLRGLKKGDEGYDKIFSMMYYGNSYYYSKAADDLFRPEWNTWPNEKFDGGKSPLWYYYFIDVLIFRQLEDDLEKGIDTEVHPNPYKISIEEEDVNVEIEKILKNDSRSKPNIL